MSVRLEATYSLDSTFNRTIVELKCPSRSLPFCHHFSFNRTIVELKCITTVVVNSGSHAFNRTIVELKFK